MFSLFFAGLMLGSGPCMVSCGPFLISYIAGTGKSVSASLKIYLLFSLARVFAYAMLSLAVFFLGSFALQNLLGEYSKYIFISAGAFIIFIGVFIALGRGRDLSYARQVKGPWHLLQDNFLRQDFKSVIVAGLSIGFLPCPPLLAMLSYVGLISRSWPGSLLYGLSFGIGTLISPLIILSLFAGLIPRLFSDKTGFFIRVFNFVCGLIIIILGIRLIIGGVK